MVNQHGLGTLVRIFMPLIFGKREELYKMKGTRPLSEEAGA